MNGGESGSKKIENFKAETTFNMKSQHNYFVCMFHYFRRLLNSS